MSDMVVDTTVVVRRRFEAAPERVFTAWTDPDALRRWYAPSDSWTTVDAQTDPRPGGTYRVAFRREGGPLLEESGEFREVVHGERLVYTCTLTAGGELECETLVRVEFRPDDGGTEVVVTEEGYPSREMRDRHAMGWLGFLDRLERHALG